MTTRNETRGLGGSVRAGFTLVELLVAMSIIAVLVSLGTAAYIRALWRAQEVEVTTKLSQLDAAIEAFKSKYGFYPPDFTRINNVNEFVPYLNRIAPNHAYNMAQLNVWWNQVGQEIQTRGPLVSYVFWLSGLSKNKQFPLSNPYTGHPLVAYNAALHADGSPTVDASNNPIVIEREVFFDFEHPRLIFAGPQNQVAGYSQFSGTPDPMVYFEIGSIPISNNAAAIPAVNVITSKGNYVVRPYFDPAKIPAVALTEQLQRRESFQLIAAGMDGHFSIVGQPTTQDPRDANKFERDNLVNFVDGAKLEILIFAQP
ncbi:MAG TPA: prepilin-type N-terminal cleavage/methylation domain-containing protein [Pirellulaceae bacterium]|nr:prepilin-type N-terminal cleavage/methylation domain-containing protein [Pirellulaceae bacterium]